MMDGEAEEYELALRARDGDRQALAELVERTRLRLFALAYAELRHYEDAQDAVAGALTDAGVAHRINTAGNLFSVFFTDTAVVDFATAKQQSVRRYAAFFHAMLERGVHLPPSAYEAWFVGATHDDAAIERVGDALPHAARAAAGVHAPELIAPPTSGDRA